jgi:hypothetical protein
MSFTCEGGKKREKKVGSFFSKVGDALRVSQEVLLLLLLSGRGFREI